jgi:hypothetical protein
MLVWPRDQGARAKEKWITNQHKMMRRLAPAEGLLPTSLHRRQWSTYQRVKKNITIASDMRQHDMHLPYVRTGVPSASYSALAWMHTAVSGRVDPSWPAPVALDSWCYCYHEI